MYPPFPRYIKGTQNRNWLITCIMRPANRDIHAVKRSAPPQALGYRCAHCTSEFDSKTGMDCHRRHHIRARFFSRLYHFFLQMTTFFSKPWICSMEFAGPMDQTPDWTYPILETFLFLIPTRRFGGVGAPEGLEIAPDILIQHFSPKLGFLTSHYG